MSNDRLSAALADHYTIERELGQGETAIPYPAPDARVTEQGPGRPLYSQDDN